LSAFPQASLSEVLAPPAPAPPPAVEEHLFAPLQWPQREGED
jgi:hypothetical protein